MNTILHKEIVNWWNGLVIIDELTEFVDDRGSLVELWRTDDKKGKSDKTGEPKMSYWSVTKPYVIRGPHQHIDQCDYFITMKGKMVYQLFNPISGEMKFFITDPTKIYRVKVETPIIHSYRNISNQDVITGNFPTALFMGKDKKGYKPDQKIDEVRHEESIKPESLFIVLGSNGRLGKSITNKLYSYMGYHTFDVIPYSEKIENENDIKLLADLVNKNLDKKIYIFNCIAKTIVVNSFNNIATKIKQYEEYNFSNVIIPQIIFNTFKNYAKIINFSTDYVFKKIESNPYIDSKKSFDAYFENEGLSSDHLNYRVSNLFSTEKSDTINILSKIGFSDSLNINLNVTVCPTSVDILADYIINNLNKTGIHNISGKPKKLIELVELAKKKKVNIVEGFWENHLEGFLNRTHITLDCDDDINKKILIDQQT